MQGIKVHTHQDRAQVIDQVIPFLKNQYQDNFIALGADGSFGHNEDLEYSDLELIAFFKELPIEHNTIRRLIDGLYIVIVLETKESYVQKYIDVADVWYASGGAHLLPLFNEPFIQGVNDYKPAEVEKKCLEQIRNRWQFYQEITAKVLNNCTHKDQESIPLTFPAMVKEVLIILSFLNTTPYVSLGKYISMAKKFMKKPEGFDHLLSLLENGEYQNFVVVEKVSTEVFSSLETILQQEGVTLYQEHL